MTKPETKTIKKVPENQVPFVEAVMRADGYTKIKRIGPENGLVTLIGEKPA